MRICRIDFQSFLTFNFFSRPVYSSGRKYSTVLTEIDIDIKRKSNN